MTISKFEGLHAITKMLRRFKPNLFFLLILIGGQLSAQELDTVLVNAKLGLVSSSQEFLPFYLKFNRNGKVDEEAPVFMEIQSSYQKTIVDDLQFEGNFAIRNQYLYEFNAQLNWKKFNLFAGRKPFILGGIDNNELTTGSMVMSRNALPIPQVGLFLDDYVDVPLTKGYVKIKGGMSHGWFEEDRWVKEPYLHLKYFKGLIDLRELIGFRVYSSVIHTAQWGGTSPDGTELPSSISDFNKIFFGQGIPNEDGNTFGEANALGNHLGMTELTLNQLIGEYELTLNYQKPFEDEGSMIYVSFTDFLMGLQVEFPEKSFIKKVYLEYLQTMRQGGPGLPDPTPQYPTVESNFGFRFGGRDDYYNNYLYRSGWTYQGKVISNPLFATYEDAQVYLGDFESYDFFIVNNRLKSWNLGAVFSPMDNLILTMLITRTINYGTYAGLYEGRFNWSPSLFDPNFDYPYKWGKVQYYSQLKIGWSNLFKGSPLGIGLILGYDTGDLYSNFGAELALTYSLLNY